MNTQDFSEALGDIQDKYIEKAMDCRARPRRWLQWIAYAACVCLILWAGLREISVHPVEPSTPTEGTEPTAQTTEPRLDIPTLPLEKMLYGGGGGPVSFAKDPSELMEYATWDHALDFDMMPVYYARFQFDHNRQQIPVNTKRLTEAAQEVFVKLGIPWDQVSIEAIDGDEREAIEVVCKAGDIEVRVNATGSVGAYIQNGAPEEFWPSYDLSEEKLVALGSYVIEHYAPFVDMAQPTVRVSVDYGFEGYTYASAYLYDAALDRRQQFLEGKTVSFSCSAEGRFHISGGTWKQQEIYGEYPVISYEEAEELLFQGVYIGRELQAYPTKEDIAGASLVYKTAMFGTYDMPYYCFLIPVPEEDLDEELKAYTYCYVPAVESRYLNQMPKAELYEPVIGD